MKYTLLRIDKNSNGVLKLHIIHDPLDRKKYKFTPSANGTYQCPLTESIEYGFEKLRKFLIEDAEKEINRIQQYVTKVKNLKIKVPKQIRILHARNKIIKERHKKKARHH